jgi:predicted nucleic acid-binding protein
VELSEIVANIEKYKLDFDDAYQLTIVQKFDLILVTFDRDFDAIGLKKMSPEEVINKQ